MSSELPKLTIIAMIAVKDRDMVYGNMILMDEKGKIPLHPPNATSVVSRTGKSLSSLHLSSNRKHKF